MQFSESDYVFKSVLSVIDDIYIDSSASDRILNVTNTM